MSEAKMTVRVQWAEGTERVELAAEAAAEELFARVREVMRLGGAAFALYRDRGRRDELESGPRRLRDLGLRHGDMLYLATLDGVRPDQPSSTEAPATSQSSEQRALIQPGSSSGAPSRAGTGAGLQEDDVDLLLYQESGTIQRQRDDKLCRHNSKGCCVHCSPLEPWDEGYLKEHNIKHLSFHSYLRKITSGKFVSLEELSCKIKPGCKEHPPWPRGICAKCQPGAVTLARQPYRHVDNVLLDHPALVERFLGYWRASTHQRLGYLYGRLERHPTVPLGIRVRVCAIYEPAQTSTRDSIALQPDPHEQLLAQIAERLKLRRVGWIFTDLLPDDLAKGTVQHIRGVDTHFLSAQECIMAGHLQNEHPNPCRYAPSGYFGSKFVTVCVTGDANNQVSLEGYQVSGQCQALVRDEVLLPTRDAPELGYIRDALPSHPVPDVYYKEKDAYGNEVSVAASRVPVAYLLVGVPVGVATEQRPALSPRAAFPPAHRALHHHLQGLRALHHHIQAAETFLEAMSDLHTLLYLATNSALPLSISQLEPLLDAVREGDALAAELWRGGAAPATLEQLARAAAERDHEHELESLEHEHEHEHEPAAELWTCALCTFHNVARRDACEMCAMPRNNAM